MDVAGQTGQLVYRSIYYGGIIAEGVEGYNPENLGGLAVSR
jgi:hypothetical protein